MKKIIALDLDGTTLNNQSLITEKTQKVLQVAQENGHEIILATGRPYRLSQQFYRQLQLKNPMVNLNGAIIHLPNQNWPLEKEFFVKRDLVFDLFAEREDLGVTFLAAENKDTFYIDGLHHKEIAFFTGEARPENLLTPKNLTSDPSSIVVGTTAENTASLRNTLKARYGSLVDIRTWGGPFSILEITQKGVQKASGLEYLARCLSFKKEDVIAFGDEHNDLEMLDWAGWGVAMKNGTSEAKKAANDVTYLTNDEDGLADYLQNYLELEKQKAV